MFCSQTFHIAVFYRPPSQHDAIDHLISTLSPLGPSFSSKLANVSTPPPTCTSLHNQIEYLVDLFHFKQLVTFPTHHSHSGSILPLTWFLSIQAQGYIHCFSPYRSLTTISPFQACPLSAPPDSHKKIWLYHKANINSINASLDETHWDQILTNDVNVFIHSQLYEDSSSVHSF